MDLKLGTNLGFAINKYFEPEVWTKIVREDLGLGYVQFVADVLNPFYPKEYLDKKIKETKKYIDFYDIKVTSVFTSAFTRVNHLMHPDEDARKYWVKWFKDFFLMASKLGATNGGSHFGILTFDSIEDEDKREFLTEEGIKNWQELSFFAKEIGFDCLIFEPMSIPREFGNTVADSKYLVDRVNENCGVPMKVCLDIGHAPHPDERDPYPWIEQLGDISPVIHLQQTVINKSNHWPFTKEYNKEGIISGEKFMASLEKSGCKKSDLFFEISHREHFDTEFRIIEDLKASVDYWRQFVKE